MPYENQLGEYLRLPEFDIELTPDSLVLTPIDDLGRRQSTLARRLPRAQQPVPAGWTCKLHGEGPYIDGCTCATTDLQAALRALTARLDDQVKVNVQLKRDIRQVREIAESRRRKVASLERQVDTYALALKSVDNAVNLARKAMREETGGRDRLIDTKSTNDPHQRIVDANGQEQAASVAR